MTAGNERKVSIAIPACDEEDAIRVTLDSVLSFSETCTIVGEIVVLENGSTDSTSAIVEEVIARDTSVDVRMVNFSHRLGFAGIICEAAAHSAFPEVIIFPADGQATCGDALALVQARDAHVVRHVFSSRVGRMEGSFRTLGSDVWYGAIRSSLGVELPTFGALHLLSVDGVQATLDSLASVPLGWRVPRYRSVNLLPILYAVDLVRHDSFPSVVPANVLPRSGGAPKGGRYVESAVSVLEAFKLGVAFRLWRRRSNDSGGNNEPDAVHS